MRRGPLTFRMVPLLVGLAAAAAPLAAQRPELSPAVRAFTAVDTPLIALEHVRVIDGTGAPARDDQTVVIREGRIAAVGPRATTTVPSGAAVLDLAGRTVIPGLVMVHEHLFYPTGPGVYGNVARSFTTLYLAGGVTSMRTAGDLNGYGDFGVKQAIDAGELPGPWIDATAPYLEGPGLGLPQVHTLTGPADARRMVDFWGDAGATSYKAYMHITRAELGAAIAEAHRLGHKLTGHLCSVTYREAAALGIDDLEHGFFVSTDFVPDKKPDVCPGQAEGMKALAAIDPAGDAARSLIADLVAHHVAVTSTLTVFETFTPGRPEPPGLDVLVPELRQRFEAGRARVSASQNSVYPRVLKLDMTMEHEFAEAGGLLLAGTDPTGFGGVIPGFSNQRELELLVEAGFTPLQAIRIGTLNGAEYLGIADRAGSIAPGKQADLVVVRGDPAVDIADVRNVEMVFKQGVGYDPAKLIASAKGSVGLY